MKDKVFNAFKRAAEEEEVVEFEERMSAIREALDTMAEEILRVTAKYDVSEFLGKFETLIFTVQDRLNKTPSEVANADWVDLVGMLSLLDDVAADIENLKWEFEQYLDAIEAMVE